MFHLPNVKASPVNATPTTIVCAWFRSWRASGCSAWAGSRHSRFPAAPRSSRNATRFVAFPTRLADWQGHVSSLDVATEQFLKVDDYILADYSRPGGKPVNLYVAYYASQRTNESPHSPIVCLPGGGWSITLLERKTFNSGGAEYPL